MYEPVDHMEELGLTLLHIDPQQGRLGLYIPRLQAILLKPGLHPHDARAVLEHEIQHHETGTCHTYTNREEQRRTERECDRRAARQLVPIDDLARALRESEDPGQWAYDLRVNGRMIRTRIEHLTANERAYLERTCHHAA